MDTTYKSFTSFFGEAKLHHQSLFVIFNLAVEVYYDQPYCQIHYNLQAYVAINDEAHCQ